MSDKDGGRDWGCGCLIVILIGLLLYVILLVGFDFIAIIILFVLSVIAFFAVKK